MKSNIPLVKVLAIRAGHTFLSLYLGRENGKLCSEISLLPSRPGATELTLATMRVRDLLLLAQAEDTPFQISCDGSGFDIEGKPGIKRVD